MTSSEIIYGIKLEESYIERLYPHNLYSHLYSDYYEHKKADGNMMRIYPIDFDELSEYLENDKVTSRKIDTMYKVNYANDSTMNINGNDTDNTIIVGIVLAKCELHYNGIMKIPVVDKITKKMMREFLNDHKELSNEVPELYSYTDSGK